MTRREFCVAAAAAQAMAALPAFGGAAGGGKKRWYKGNMHCHTYWSDGRAFPDQAIRSVPPKKGVTYTIKFISTKRGVDTGVVHTVGLASVGQPDKGGRPARTVPIYSREIGATVKSVSGRKGERVAAEYSLASDDLYVRARVESDEQAPYYAFGGKYSMHPKTSMAWTQPYQRT